MDRIMIRGLCARCIIGTGKEERRERQDVTMDIVMFADLRHAGHSDRIEHTVDYRAIKKKVLAMVEQSEFFLVEALAEAVADICLGDPKVVRVQVQVDNPTALRFARTIGVRIMRTRGENP